MLSYIKHENLSMNAVFLGLAIPALLFGRAVFAIIVILGLITTANKDNFQQALCVCRSQIKTSVGIFITIALICWTISALGSSLPIRSLEAVWRSWIFLFVGIFVFTVFENRAQSTELVERTLVAASLGCAIIALIEITLLPELYWALRFKGWESTPLHTELKSYSSLAVFLIPLCLAIGWSKKGWWQFLALATAITFLLLVILNYNRAAMAGLLSAGVLSLILLLVRFGAKTFLSLALITLGSVIWYTLDWLHTSRVDIVRKSPTGDWWFPIWLVDFQRQTIWEHVSTFTLHNSPFFGIGPNTINFIPGANSPLPGNETLNLIPAHPHSWLFEIFAETGLVGCGVLVIALTLITWRLTKTYLAFGNPMVLCSLGIMASYWVSGLFNFSFWSAWWQTSFFLSMAFALACSKKNIETQSTDRE